MSDAKITLLAWLPIPPRGPNPPETTCLFSDGVEFWTGWWKGDHVLVKTAGPHQILAMDAQRRLRLRWAKLNNMTAIFAEGDAVPRLLQGPSAPPRSA